MITIFSLINGEQIIGDVYEEDDSYKIFAYTDGTPLIKDFSLQKFPTPQQIECNVDPHYLGIKKLKNI